MSSDGPATDAKSEVFEGHGGRLYKWVVLRPPLPDDVHSLLERTTWSVYSQERHRDKLYLLLVKDG